MPYKRGTKYIGQIKRSGKKKEKSFRTMKEAKAWEAQMWKVSNEDWNEPINITCLADWANAYLDYSKARYVRKTYLEKRLAFRELFETIDPDMPVENLTPAKVMSCVQSQSGKRSGYAANKVRKNLVAGWNWGMRYMAPVLPGPNPCLVDKMPEIRNPRYVPPEKDFWNVFDLTEGQDRVMLLTFLYLAARRSEVFRMKVDDLDFENGRVRLWTRKRKDGTFESDWLPMVPDLQDALSWWLKNRPVNSDNVFVCLDKTAFTQEYYGNPFKYRQHLFERLCEKADVKRFGFHSIRHLTASQLYKNGCSLAEIQMILRHKSPSTTERYLKTLGVESVRSALESIKMPEKKVSGFKPKLIVGNKAEMKKAV